MLPNRTMSFVLLIALTVAALGCGGGDRTAATTTSTEAEPTSTSEPEPPPPPCDPADPPTVREGQLVVATGQPAFEPWVVGDDPANGQGYEAALVYEVAAGLGFETAEVEWIRTGFDEALAVGVKDYDLNVQQFAITPDRDRAVDFSASYYDVEQVLVGAPDGPLAEATSLGDLEGARLGVVLGTPGVDAVAGLVADDSTPEVLDDPSAAAAALRDGDVDGLVVDLPTAHTLLEVELPDSAILGVLPQGDDPEQLGFVLVEDSGLTGCVNGVLSALREDGTLEALQEQWLRDGGAVATLDG